MAKNPIDPNKTEQPQTINNRESARQEEFSKILESQTTLTQEIKELNKRVGALERKTLIRQFEMPFLLVLISVVCVSFLVAGALGLFGTALYDERALYDDSWAYTLS